MYNIIMLAGSKTVVAGNNEKMAGKQLIEE
jgi:hypothetical protein